MTFKGAKDNNGGSYHCDTAGCQGAVRMTAEDFKRLHAMNPRQMLRDRGWTVIPSDNPGDESTIYCPNCQGGESRYVPLGLKQEMRRVLITTDGMEWVNEAMAHAHQARLDFYILAEEERIGYADEWWAFLLKHRVKINDLLIAADKANQDS